MIRAHLIHDMLGYGFYLSIVMSTEGTMLNGPQIRRVVVAEDGRASLTWEEFDPHGENVAPTLRLTLEDAHALYEALSEMKVGTSEMRALRRDYDAERGRVDQALTALIEIGKGRS